MNTVNARSVKWFFVGALAAAIIGGPVTADAYTAIKRMHGASCLEDTTDVNGWSYYLQRGITLISEPNASSHAICPLYSSQDLELDTIDAVEILITTASANDCTIGTIKTCTIDDTSGATACSTASKSTDSANGGCNRETYTLNAANQLDQWATNPSGYPYLYITNPAPAAGISYLTIFGYKMYSN